MQHQLAQERLSYLSDFWNRVDLVHLLGNAIGNVIRLVNMAETGASKIILTLACITMYFNILYYLRAFDSTGPLVSMILKISADALRKLYHLFYHLSCIIIIIFINR